MLGLGILLTPTLLSAQVLEVKPDRAAIVRTMPDGDAPRFDDRLPPGTRVEQIDTANLYYEIRLPDGRTGWSYKANFVVVSGAASTGGAGPTPASLTARTDVLKIVVLDVEVGDATLIICPAEAGKRDVILIDTGENDDDRILAALGQHGFALSGRPITRFIVTHYDRDHFGDAPALVPLCRVVYDHGNNNVKDTDEMTAYLNAVGEPGVDRRTMRLSYDETFSGGVRLECAAVNQATDFDTGADAASPEDNPNSIALLCSFGGFDYFTGGDLTFKPERSLATGIRNCDVYHVNHHGSRATSSDSAFVERLDPEVSVASNGILHGHPTRVVAQRLVGLGSRFYHTNCNDDPRAHQPNTKFVGDDTLHEEGELEEEEGASGTITIVVDPVIDKYYVLMAGLPLSEATFTIEH